MFRIANLPRTMTRAEFSRIWRIVRTYERYSSRVDNLLAHRCILAEAIRERAEDGKVALNVRSMDCDCAESTDAYIMPASAFAVERLVSKLYEWAEGPMSWWITKPSERVEHTFRDLALEAFEDGHPHVVRH